MNLHEPSTSSNISLSAFSAGPSKPSTSSSKEEKRLENMRKAEEKWRETYKSVEKKVSCYDARSRPKRNLLSMYVLDISHALDEKPYVTWLPLKNDGMSSQGPEETVLYTLVEGRSELIMFGGIQKDPASLACTTNLSNQVSNTIHFITAPKYVI